MSFLEVTVRERDQPPDNGKGQPRQEEAESERQQRPAPLRIDQSSKNVLQEAQPSPVQLGLHNIAVAVLEDRPLSESFRGSRTEVPASCEEDDFN